MRRAEPASVRSLTFRRTPGTVLGVLTALEAGGGSMYAIAWPLSGLFMISLAAVLGEMASTWPVAGAMFTWVFRLCRSKKRLNPWARYASWVVGSLLLCSHVLLQVRELPAPQPRHATELFAPADRRDLAVCAHHAWRRRALDGTELFLLGRGCHLLGSF